jgi:hypothetical protein
MLGTGRVEYVRRLGIHFAQGDNGREGGMMMMMYGQVEEARESIMRELEHMKIFLNFGLMQEEMMVGRILGFLREMRSV